MESLIRFLKIDINIQRLLFFMACITVVSPPFLIFSMTLLGLWQMLSSMYVWSRLRDDVRRQYMIFGLILFVTIILVMGLVFSFDLRDFGILVMLFGFGVVGVTLYIGFWHLDMTKRTLAKLLEQEMIGFSPKEMETILDTDEIFEDKKFEL